ncbi:MAG: hypothetical protein ACHQD6_09545 [Steroidobacterales bacterium]|jgi:uncharacterized lipoprotein
MKIAAGFMCLTLLAGVSGCHTLHNRLSHARCSESQTYLGETSVAPLKVPVGLDVPDTTNALRLPNPKGPAPPARPRTAPCLDQPPSFKVEVPKPTPQA